MLLQLPFSNYHFSVLEKKHGISVGDKIPTRVILIFLLSFRTLERVR